MKRFIVYILTLIDPVWNERLTDYGDVDTVIKTFID